MSQPPPPLPPLQYSTYAPPYGAIPGPPTSIKAIGITGVILGGLTLLNHILGVLLFVGVPAATAAYGPTYKAFQIGNSLVFGTAAAVLVAGSIGCLMRAEWGRVTLLGYAVAYPTLVMVGTGVTIGWVIPSLMAPHATGPNGPATIVGAYGGAVFAGLALLVLPAFILVYLRRPYVRAAFGTGGAS